jgi:glycerophosphoryl diester phosphodiesterase
MVPPAIPTTPGVGYVGREWRSEDGMTSSPRVAPPHFALRTTGRPLIIAHRGASARSPENTLAAFEAAWADGADAIEFDVRPTRDGELIVLHDGTLDRTADLRGVASRMTLEDIRRRRTRFGGVTTDHRIPTLREVLELLPAGKRSLIEVKAKGTAPHVLATIRETGTLDRAGVCSFLASELRWLALAEPRLPLILNLPWWRFFRLEALVDHAAKEGFSGVFVFPGRASSSLVARAHERGLEVHAGAVDAPEEAARLIAMGVDAIETNDPAAVLPALAVPA